MYNQLFPSMKVASAYVGVTADRWDAFISYRRERGAEVARLVSAKLNQRSVQAFLDVDDLGPGHFPEKLLKCIESAPNFIVILSPDSLEPCTDERDWLRLEIVQALKTGKNVIPIMLPGFKFPEGSSLPVDLQPLTTQQAVQYSHEFFDATIDKLVGYLRRSYAGRTRPLVITIIGPHGTGKSTLARKAARIITRCNHGPNVLLVDGDIFGRGLTAQIEEVTEVKCRHVYDAIVGEPTGAEPVELTESFLGREEWPSPEDGRVFFLPSIRKEARGPFIVVANKPSSEMQRVLKELITSAAYSCRAESIIIDTAPVAEPCAAALASMSDLIIAVGDKDHGEDAIEDHVRRLTEFEPGVARVQRETVFNQIDLEFCDKPGTRYPMIPTLGGLQSAGDKAIAGVDIEPKGGGGEAIADNVDFEQRVLRVLSPCFSRKRPKLVPPWCAPLPREWRKLAVNIGESEHKRAAFWQLARTMFPIFARRGAVALGIGTPALACLYLTFSISKFDASLNATQRFIWLTFGFGFLAVAVLQLVRVISEFRNCLAVASRLARKDLDWFVIRLRLKPRERGKSFDKRWKLATRRVDKLQRVVDTLSRSIGRVA
jgi:hypothetical protein